MIDNKKEINWKQILNKATKLLQFLISIDTSQDNEIILAQHVARLLDNQGLQTKVYEPQKKRGSLVVHLPGGDKPPIILLSHLDTVPAIEDKWPFPPYSGQLKDGKIHGRGAIDCKGLLTMHTAVITAINQLNLKLNRDLYLVSTAGEEEGGAIGANWLLTKHPELKTAKYVLSEGGGFRFKTTTGNYQLCQIGEKGELKLSINSKLANSQILTYARTAAEKIKLNNKLPQPTPLTDKLNMNRIFTNKVKQKGTAIIFETVPEVNLEKLFWNFSNYIKQQDSAAQIVISDWTAGRTSNRDTLLYQTIKEKTSQQAAAEIVPYITPGYSDNRYFRNLGIKVYGYQPLLSDCKASWIHGVGERISLDSLKFGIQLLFKIITTAFRTE